MICQNCQATVDNDLVFCTSCGTRLNETWSQTPTVLIGESVATNLSVEHPPKAGSNFRWIALIVALIAVPVSLFAAYLIFINSRQQPIATNQSKPSNSTANRSNKPNPNKTANVAANNNSSNSTPTISNTEVNSASNPETAEELDDEWLDENAPGDYRTEIWGERIGIGAENHFAVPFSVDGNDKIIGIVKTLQGIPVEGLVYTQAAFDEHFPEPDFKMFSFGGEKDAKIEQTLVKGKYVLVLMNKSKKPILIYGKVFTVLQDQ